MTPQFEDDFAKGEREAARLVGAMERALKRAEQFEASAAKDAQLRKRLAQQTRTEVAQDRIKGETIGEKPAQRITRRARDEEAINRQLRERGRLAQREQQMLEAQARAMQRLRQFGPYAYTQQSLGLSARARGVGALPPAGGTGGLPWWQQQELWAAQQLSRRGVGGGQPPTGFYDPRALPPGSYPQNQLGPGTAQIGRGPFAQQALPAAGQTVGGSRYYEAEAGAQQGATRASRAYSEAKGAEQAATARTSRGLGENLGILGQANTEYQRFGALSSEWIGAASRGATTIQELGRQTAVTIGKFGGWLAAGSLLYTALGAVRAIGAGAIDSASGVNQLQRVVNNVNPDTAQRGFRQRSEKFNLPIDTVAQAGYEMGKIFHDQDKALQASDAVLYSVKVGELGVADSARYLTAITRGFNLEASDTPGIFDQINAAQNRFGISIADVEAGLAKAAGTFRASGGDFSHLLAIITTAQKATGQTGQVVGTAIARAPNFLRQPKNQAALQSFGINAKDDIDKIIEQAFVKAQGLSGQRLQVLAASIFGPQYGARVGVPLLQNYEQYQKVLERTSPQAAKGSAQKELNTLLGSMSELLTRIITELQIMGSELAEGGFLDVLVGGVQLLNNMLRGVNDLLEVFNQLPTPLRHTLAILAEIYGVIRLLRRFNLGDSFAAGSAGRGVFSRPDRTKRLYDEGLTGQQSFLVQQREREAGKAAQASVGERVAQRRLAEEQSRLTQIGAVQGANSEAALAQQRNVTRAEGQLLNVQERKLAAEVAEEEILLTQIAVEDKKTLLANARNEAEVRSLAAREGDIIPTNFNKPLSGREAASARGYSVARDAEGAPYLVQGGSPAAAAELEAQKVANGASRFGTSGRVLASAGGKAKVAFGRMATGLRTAATSIASMGTGLLAALGPLDALLIATFALMEFIPQLSDTAGRSDQAIADLKKLPTDVKDYRAQQRKVSDLSGITQQGGSAGAGDYGVSQTLFGQAAYDILSGADSRRIAAIERNARLQGIRASTLYGAGRGTRGYKGQANLRGIIFPTEVANAMSLAVDQFAKGPGKDFGEFQQRVNNLVAIVRNARNLTGPQKDKIISDLRIQAANAAPIAATYQQIAQAGADALKKSIDKFGTVVGGGLGRGTDVRRLSRQALVQISQGLQHGAGGRVFAEDAVKQVAEIGSMANDRLTQDLLFAKSNAEINRAYSRFYQRTDPTRIIGQQATQLRRNLQRQRQQGAREIAAVRQQLQSHRGDQAGIDLPFGVSIFGGSQIEGDLRKRLRGLTDNQKTLDKDLHTLNKAQKLAARELRAAREEIRQQQVQEAIDSLQTRAQIESARVSDTDPVAGARAILGGARAALSKLRASGAKDKDIQQAILAVVQGRNDVADAVKQQAQEMADATEQLAEARAHGDPILVARAQITKARADLRLAETVAERKTALAELIQAQDALDQAIADIAVARLQLAEARTDDPVKQATLRVREAEVQLQHAHGALERLQAQAAKAQALKDRRDAIAQARIDDIEFQADIGRITVQQEISAYERLLNTLQLSRQMRRDIRRKIHDLKQQMDAEAGGFELSVSDIQLPTIYDIRRAVQGGVNQSAVYQDNSQTSVTIYAGSADATEVAQEVGNVLGRANKANRRSAGVAG